MLQAASKVTVSPESGTVIVALQLSRCYLLLASEPQGLKGISTRCRVAISARPRKYHGDLDDALGGSLHVR